MRTIKFRDKYMKNILILLAVLLSSCQSERKEPNFISPYWKVYNLSDSTMLAFPSFKSDIQKPFIIRTIK